MPEQDYLYGNIMERPPRNIKPLGYRAYGSIPHLPGSRLGPGDHHCGEGQARIATIKTRDRHDVVIVQEKLDGSNCSVAKIEGRIIALSRAGYEATTSEFPVHQAFAEYVELHQERFSKLLNEGERVVGEYLGQAIGTRYKLIHEPFVPFDLMIKQYRLPYQLFSERVKDFHFTLPTLLSIGSAFSVEQALKAIQISGHGAIDPVEGVIWRVERKGEVDFLTKFVWHDKEDGKYFPENTGGKITWNVNNY